MKYDPGVNASVVLHQQNMIKAETGIVALTPKQKSIHNNFRESARALKKSLVRTIYYLGAIKHQKIHKMMGYRTIDDYAFDVAGLTPKQTRNFLGRAPKLPAFQEVERAVDQGSISLAKAQEICNHINPRDQEHWKTQAASTSLKDLKRRLRTPRDQPTLPRIK